MEWPLKVRTLLIAVVSRLREAFRANQFYVATNMKVSPIYPAWSSLRLRDEQLFFIQLANNWCGHETSTEYQENQIQTDLHRPSQFRLIGPPKMELYSTKWYGWTNLAVNEGRIKIYNLRKSRVDEWRRGTRISEHWLSRLLRGTCKCVRTLPLGFHPRSILEIPPYITSHRSALHIWTSSLPLYDTIVSVVGRIYTLINFPHRFVDDPKRIFKPKNQDL